MHSRRRLVARVRRWWAAQPRSAQAALGAGLIIALCLLPSLVRQDTDGEGLPPGVITAARKACQLPLADIETVELREGKYQVVCSYAPFSWPRQRPTVTCFDGTWSGPANFGGGLRDYGIAC
jgi:hypothetical protein